MGPSSQSPDAREIRLAVQRRNGHLADAYGDAVVVARAILVVHRRLRRGPVPRQLEPEGRAAAAGAEEPDRAVVRLDDLPRDCEAEPGAGDAGLAGLAPEELRED